MKILLLTHNPICTNNNMGKTFLTLFSKFDPASLCQLYVHPSIPDVEMCHSHYRITDKQVLKSLPFGRPGGEIAPEEIAQQMEKRKSGTLPSPLPRGSSGALSRLLRDAMWKMSHWYSKDLKKWLDREKPTCIFLAPGYAKFIYDMATRISKDRNIPIVTYVCDDYYFVQTPKGILEKFCLAKLQKKMDGVMRSSARLVTISEELKEVYQHHFNVPADVVMTGANMARAQAVSDVNEVKTLSYFGNLGEGRYRSLADIAQAIEKINQEKGTDLKIKIYTPETTPEYLDALKGISCVELCGFVSGKAFEEAFAASDMLIHTESFEPEYIDRVKYSVSTKIADSLASGIPLLAYGPDSVSSMRHLISHGCAVTVTSSSNLQSTLEEAVFNGACLKESACRGIETAAKYHDKERNSAKLGSIFAEVEKDKR